MSLYPWLVPHWQSLSGLLRASRLSHAWLFSGAPGMGKRALADEMAKSLLCTSVSEVKPCLTCRGCQLTSSGHHPDLMCLEKREEDDRPVSIDAVRTLSAQLAQHAFAKGARVVIIDPIDVAGLPALNALLKTLEEPPPDCYFILISTQRARLPATILSRCQVLHFGPIFNSPVTEQWLKGQGVAFPKQALLQSGGAPLRCQPEALEAIFATKKTILLGLLALSEGHSTAAKLSDQWGKWESAVLLDALRYVCERGIYESFRVQGAAQIDTSLPAVYESKRIKPSTWYQLLDKIVAWQRLAAHHLNTALIADAWLAVWRQAIAETE